MEKENAIKIPCEIYSRVAGYYRPVDKWNVGKQQEFLERKVYKYNENGDEKTINIQKRKLFSPENFTKKKSN